MLTPESGGNEPRISEIAEPLGYTDLAYFSNIFKKMMGRAPSEYRKRPMPTDLKTQINVKISPHMLE